MNDLNKLPRDLRDYIDSKVESGEYRDEVEVLAAAVAIMRQEEEDTDALRREIDLGIAAADAGRFSDRTVMQIAEQTKRKMQGR